MIKAIVDQTGCAIDVEDDGTVAIASPDNASVPKGDRHHQEPHHDARGRRDLQGQGQARRALGAFVEFAPGKDGLCTSPRSTGTASSRSRTSCSIGDEVEVKIIEVDRDGRVRFSRKALLAEA